MKKYRIRERIIMLFTIVFGIFSVLVFGNTILNNTTIFNVTNPVITFAFVIVYIGVIVAMYFTLKKHKRILDKEIPIIAMIFVILLVIQIIYSYNCYTEYGWDCGKVLKSAEELLINYEFDSNYYSQYYNNIYIMLFFKEVYNICSMIGITNFLYTSVLINIIAIDTSIFIIYLISKKIFGKYGGYASLLFSIPVLGLSPWMIVPYTDTLSMVFPILVFYLYLLIKENETQSKKMILSILLGICIVIGMLIKPTAIIIAIALILVKILFWEWKQENIKRAGTVLLCVAIGVFLSYAIAGWYKDKEIGKFVSEEKSEQLEFPMTHFIMMGLKTFQTEDGKFAYGVFDQDDAVATASHDGKSNKVEYNLKEIKTRLQNMGITGYISFAYHKLNWILCDGSFFYGGEGSFHTSDPLTTGKLADVIQNFSYITSKNYDIYQSFLQAMWIIVQFFIIISIFLIKENGKDKNITIIRIVIFGICLFIVLFEGRSRYLINHLPFFILLATYGFMNIKKEKNELKLVVNKIKK